MSKPIINTDAARLWCGDALTVLAEFPDESVDLVLADPPYNSGGRTPAERRAATSRLWRRVIETHHEEQASQLS